MSCPESTSIGAYVLGALEDTERDTLRSHLSQCQDCHGELRDLAGLPELLRGLSLAEVEALDASPAAPPPRTSQPRRAANRSITRAPPAGVSDQGEGPPVVLLRGQPGSMLTWSRVAPLLSNQGLRVLAVDRPGYGRYRRRCPRRVRQRGHAARSAR